MKKTVPCPKCGAPLNPAALLGTMNAGKNKKVSTAESERRRKRLAVARANRWPQSN